METDKNLLDAQQHTTEEKKKLRKIIFLDVDGVLNSVKTAAASGGYPFTFEDKERHKFDWHAIWLLQKVVLADPTVEVVFSSFWRTQFKTEEAARFFGLPIKEATPVFNALRGTEIQDWLNRNADVTHYCIIDDNNEMLDNQQPHFVHTDPYNGYAYKDFVRTCNILHVNPTEAVRPRAQTWGTA